MWQWESTKAIAGGGPSIKPSVASPVAVDIDIGAAGGSGNGLTIVMFPDVM
jgi:hypothetical protein